MCAQCSAEYKHAGVLNIVSGDSKDIGEAILSSHKVRKIGFTGSTRAGAPHPECGTRVQLSARTLMSCIAHR